MYQPAQNLLGIAGRRNRAKGGVSLALGLLLEYFNFQSYIYKVASGLKK
jgi:hypothetical protein